MDPKLLEIAIEDRIKITGKKPKAIIPVHLYGMPAKMDEIMAIAEKYGIPVLEDAAEAAGVSKFLATQARDNAPHYQHSHIGYNYRLSNICAGIGRGQMLVLDEHIAARRDVNRRYIDMLSDLPGISFLKNPSKDFESNMWLTCILIEPKLAGFNREELRLAMEAANIETRPVWKPMHMQPIFAEAPFYGHNNSSCFTSFNNDTDIEPELENSVCGQLFEKGLCLPSHPGLSEEDLERVVGVFTSLAAR